MTATQESVQLSRRGHISLVTFQPLDDGTISTIGAAALGQIIERELDDEDVRAIILTGASNGIFIRHGNLAEIGHAAASLASGAVNEEDFLASPFATLCTLLDRATKPVIAAINGHCMGGGFEIALACTMRIAAASTTAIGLPEIRIGIPPGVGGPQRLARLIGWHRARLFALSGTVIGADGALAMGIIDDIVDDAVEAAMRRAEAFAGRSPRVVSEIMRQMKPSDDRHVRESIRGFARSLTAQGMSEAFAELAGAKIAIEQLD